MITWHWSKLSTWGPPYLPVEDMDRRIDEAHTNMGSLHTCVERGVDGGGIFLPREELAGANADRYVREENLQEFAHPHLQASQQTLPE